MPKVTPILATAVVLALIPDIASAAGTWAGGGGELIESTMNPWFIIPGFGPREVAPHGLTPSINDIINYCVDLDSDNFGISATTAINQVANALADWQTDFEGAYIPDNGPAGNRVHVAREQFRLSQPCTDQIPLRFQLGKLTPDQLHGLRVDMMAEPTTYVGMAIRTDYQASLNGRGFVYISPPKGPLAMTDKSIAADVWSKNEGTALLAVLRHELGHVFGLGHSGTYSHLMSAQFPEYVVGNSDKYRYITEHMFLTPSGVPIDRYCGDDPKVLGSFRDDTRQILAVPSDAACIAVRYNRSYDEHVSDTLDVLALPPNINSLPTVIGTAELSGDHREFYSPLVRLWLPEGQTVFKDVPDYLRKVLNGPMATTIERAGTYRSLQSGEEHAVSVQLSPNSIQVNVVDQGRIHLGLTTFAGQATHN